jgi:hypothetical protein
MESLHGPSDRVAATMAPCGLIRRVARGTPAAALRRLVALQLPGSQLLPTSLERVEQSARLNAKAPRPSAAPAGQLEPRRQCQCTTVLTKGVKVSALIIKKVFGS